MSGHVLRRTIREKLLKGLDDELGKVHPRQQLALAVLNRLPQLAFVRSRATILRAGGFRIGKDSLVLGDLILSGGGDWQELFSIGSRTVITGPLRVNLGAEVCIGSNVRIGHDVLLVTVSHEIGSSELRCGAQRLAPIVIGDGVWIASRVTILPGVTVGDGSVVAAGAVVTTNVEADCLVGGVPAKLIRKLDTNERSDDV
jgi:carbonic anhydrase/acetyltransferase-like protein (isoleucine patch superfamily)